MAASAGLTFVEADPAWTREQAWAVCRRYRDALTRRPELRGHGVTVKRVQLAGKYGPRWTFAIYAGKLASCPES